MEPGEFIRPPEAPVFQPTIEEFKDPIAYLNKIRPVVVNTGICKIKPPLVSDYTFGYHLQCLGIYRDGNHLLRLILKDFVLLHVYNHLMN